MFAFKLRDEIDNFTVFDVSNALRERGWQVPAYTFPKNRTDLAALRVVVRRGFTHDLADLLVARPEAAAATPAEAAGAGARRADRIELPLTRRRREDMCRWLAYSGSPVLIEELLYKPKHSLIDQSLHSQLGAETTNGDGFGIGWYGVGETPGVFHSIEPAWNDRNLRELAAHRPSPLVFAHIRASSGVAGPADELPPVPPRQLAVDAQRRRSATSTRSSATSCSRSTRRSIPTIEGSTDSEVFFFLALTLGLEDDPPAAVERAVGLIEETGRRHGVEHPIQMTVATTDGDAGLGLPLLERGQVAVALLLDRRRHACAGCTRTPGAAQTLDDETRLVVSEPLGDLAGRVERGARVELRRHPRGAGRAAAVHAATSVLRRVGARSP